MNPDNEDAAKKEHARIEGVWSFSLVEVNGAKQPDVPFETNKMILLKNGDYIVVQGTRITRGTLKRDPTTMPKHYDVMVTTGSGKGLTYLGIYELEGDTLKICLPFGKERPADFVSKPGSGLIFQVFKREKKDVVDALLEVARQELAGPWQGVSYIRDGKNASVEDLQKIKLTLDSKTTAAAFHEGGVSITGTTEINPAAKPMTIDVTYTEGEMKGQTVLGICTLENDLLTICRTAPGKVRPSEFASKPGSGHTLVSYKRESATTK